jgi:hypothetical protein
VNNTTNLRETIIKEKTPFKFSISNLQIIKESMDPDNPDAPIQFEGMASTTEKSGNRNKMMPNAIQKMKDTCMNLPMFWDHDESRRAASIIDCKDSNKSEFWPIGETAPLVNNPVLDAPILQVKRDLEDPNCEVGMSIGGMILKAKFVEDMDTGDWWIEIEDIELYEVSLTTIPALSSTKGKTKILNSCKDGLCGQILQSIKNNKDLPIYEAIQVLEQRKGQSNELNQKLEVKTMDEETKTLIENQNKKIEGILEYINKDIEAKEKATKEAQEKQAREELKEELKEEVAKEFKEEVAPAIAGAIKEQLDGFKQELFGDRNHIQQSATITKEGQKPDGNLQAPIIINQEAKDPHRSIAENHKSVIMGKTVMGKTPSEMFA